MRRSDESTSVLLRLARLALLAVVFVAAARSVPTTGALQPTLGSSGSTEALLDAFDAIDRPIVARGRAPDIVGSPAPSLDFRSLQGGSLPLQGVGRPVLLSFMSADCERCDFEAQKLSVISVVYFEDLHVVAVAAPGDGAAVQRTIDEAGGIGLVLGAEDTDGEIASALWVERRPTLVVVGATGTVDAVWSEDVPLGVLYSFLREAYGVDGQGEKPLAPQQPGSIEDG